MTNSAELPPNLQPATSQEHRLFYWIALPIFVIDQLTKYYIIQTVPLNTSMAPIESWVPYFKFSHIANTGATFGIFQEGKWFFTVLAFLVSLGIMFFNWQLPALSSKLRVALGLIFGGAAGNLLNRILVGHVTDFLHFDFSSVIDIFFANWYVFNVADTAVVAGTAYMAYLTIFQPDYVTRELPKNPPDAADSSKVTP